MIHSKVGTLPLNLIALYAEQHHPVVFIAVSPDLSLSTYLYCPSPSLEGKLYESPAYILTVLSIPTSDTEEVHYKRNQRLVCSLVRSKKLQ